jgi:hypothetical protein
MSRHRYYINPSALKKEGWTAKQVIYTSLAGTVVLGAGIFFVNRHFKKKQKDKVYKKSAEYGTPGYYANQFYMAFDNDNSMGWGTDEELIRRLFRQIPSQEDFEQIAAAYYALVGKQRTLQQALSDELQTSELNEMMAILNSKPRRRGDKKPVPLSVSFSGWADRLKAAFDYSYGGIIGGTDEAAITAVLNEMPTQAAFMQTGQVYKLKYNRDLLKDLKDELTDNGWSGDGLYNEALAILHKKPTK